MFGLGMTELVVIAIVAVLLFGKRLPEVAKTVGHHYNEMRRWMSEMQSSVDFTSTSYPSRPASNPSPATATYDDDRDADRPTAPKFEPPPSEPREEAVEAVKPVAEHSDAAAAT